MGKSEWRLETGVGPVTDRILGNVIDKISSEEFRTNVLSKIVEPVVVVVSNKIKPYLLIAFVLYLVLFVMLIYIIVCVTRMKSKKIL